MELGGRTLFRGFNFTFENGQRVGVCGRNGLGKTTLLKIIIGQLAPTEGTVKTGQLTKFNYVDQGAAAIERGTHGAGGGRRRHGICAYGAKPKFRCARYLKRFLFADDRITTQVKHLSGGERSRLLLARILKSGGNFLILDEPTNDLDLPTLRVLEEALIAFPGAVLVVSHDRYFLNRVCTDILAFEGDGKIHHSVGDYDYYLEKKQRAGCSGVSAERRHHLREQVSGALPSRRHRRHRARPSPANCPSRKRANWKAWRRKSTPWTRKSPASKACSPRRIFTAPTPRKPASSTPTSPRRRTISQNCMRAGRSWRRSARLRQFHRVVVQLEVVGQGGRFTAGL